MRQIAIHISKWYRSQGLYRTDNPILCSRKQEEADADGDAHLYIERAYYIYAKQVEPGHTSLYICIPAQYHPNRPKTTENRPYMVDIPV